MAFQATITKTDGSKIIYNLKSSQKLRNVNPDRKVVLFFNNGEVYQGYTDGIVDEDSDFSLKAHREDKCSYGLPFGRLMGWAYESDGKIKISWWARLKEKRDWIIGAFALLVSVSLVVALCCAIEHAQTKHEAEEHNIDSLRRAHRALIERQREAQLKTLEDSIHYYEDGY